MPVRFKGSTEYQNKFSLVPKRNSPTKSRSPLVPAGLSTLDKASSNEPPLQRRKKPLSLSKTDTTYFDEHVPGPDDYDLLGDHQKFASNVKYKNRVAASKSMPNGLVDRNVERPRRSESTQTFSPPPKPLVTELKRTQHEASSGEPPLAARNDKEAGPDVVSRMPGQSSADDQDNYALKYKLGMARRHVAGPKRASEYQREFKWKNPVDHSPLIGAHEIFHSGGAQNEMYTDTKQPTDQQVPASASVPVVTTAKPHQPKSPTKTGRSNVPSFVKSSEYRRQFKPWDVYRKTFDHSGTRTVAAMTDPAPPQVSVSSLGAARHHQTKFGKHSHRKRKTRLKRSQSLSALTPEKRPPAGIPTGLSVYDKRLLRESLNTQRLHFPHGKFRKWLSEYQANFKSPSSFSYDEGAWHGAAPAHISPEVEPAENYQYINTDNTNNNNVAPAQIISDTSIRPSESGSWYAEVVELRKKALEYRQRAQGTHFSREHMAQLLAKQADLWDQESSTTAESNVTESTLSAVSSPSAEVVPPEQRQPPALAETKLVRPMKPGLTESMSRESQTGINENVISNKPEVASAESTETTTSVSSFPTKPRPQVSSAPRHHFPTGEMGYQSDDEASPTCDEGRIPTPVLKEVPVKTFKTRHHLDTTTPSMGGVLLSSPPPQRTTNPTPNMASGLETSTGVSEQTNEALRANHVSATGGATSSLRSPSLNRPFNPQVSVSPTFGMPTRDTHVLLDEESPIDRALDTVYVRTTPVKGSPSQARHSDSYSTIKSTHVQTEPVSNLANSLSVNGRPMSAHPSSRAPSATIDHLSGRRKEKPPMKKPSLAWTVDMSPEDRRATPHASGKKLLSDQRTTTATATTPVQQTKRHEARVSAAHKTDSNRVTSTSAHHVDKHKRTSDWVKQRDGHSHHRHTSPYQYPSAPHHREEENNSFDDVLSTSAASSCSLASEVLERARKRRDNFW